MIFNVIQFDAIFGFDCTLLCEHFTLQTNKFIQKGVNLNKYALEFGGNVGLCDIFRHNLLISYFKSFNRYTILLSLF